MTKSELIRDVAAIANDNNIKATEKIVNAVFDTIKNGLIESGTVEVKNFGKFGVKDVKERKGRNPRTGEDIVIAAHKFPYFKSGKVLKDAVNGNG